MVINTSKIAKKKSAKLQEMIIFGVEIIEAVGVPVADLTARRLEKMSMVFLALCAMTTSKQWGEVSSVKDRHILKTREIIEYLNKHFEESISFGSYDDIRRKDLIRLVAMGLVIKSANNPNADTNDGTRGYAIDEKFASLIKKYKTTEWKKALSSFEVDQDFIDSFHGKRNIQKLNVKIETGVVISLDKGPHNEIQKAVIEEFLPVYGYNAKVLYVGDTSEKHMHQHSEQMMELGLSIEDRGMLPDIVAFSEDKKWLYLIEAVHSSNPLNPERCIELQRTILKECPYGVVFITAFLTKKDFAKWLPQIAWETEVWLVESPQHLIHFNGDKFLGPHKSPPVTHQG